MLRKIILLFLCAVILISSCSAVKNKTINTNAPENIEQKNDASFSLDAPSFFYGRKQHVALNKKEKSVLAKVDANYGKICSLSGALVKVARRHASNLADKKIDVSYGADYLRSDLLYYGVYDYRVKPVVFELTDAGINQFLKILGAESSQLTHCGIGISDGDNPVGVWLGLNRLIKITPFKVNPAPDSNINIKGKFINSEDYDIDAFLQNPDGSVKEIKTYVLGRRSFSLTVHVSSLGKYILELQITGKNGAETAVLVPLFSGVKNEIIPVVFPDSDSDECSLSEQLLLLTNAVRHSMKIPILKRDARLDKIAAAHSREMASKNFFGHLSHITGMADDRLAKKRLFPKVIAENVAKSTSISRVHHNLMSSPSHRIKILDPQFSTIGIGVVKKDNQVIVTEIFVKW